MGKLIILVMLLLSCCGYGDIDYIKNEADKTWASQGFKIRGYDGYQIGFIIPFTSYGGAYV